MTELPVQVLDAPIVAVAVYPDRARVTRRGRLTLPAGDQTVYVDSLPLGLQEDSVRVSGRGPATVLGVDVAMRHHAQAPDAAVAELERERRAAENEVAELADADEVQAQLDAFLSRLGQRAGGTFARSLASGSESADLGEFTDSLAVRLTAVRAKRRELAAQQEDASERLAAVERRLAEVSQQRVPDRRSVGVDLAVDGEAEVEIELSYVVPGAGWSSTYDVRVAEDRLTLNWFGVITQHTGEDWPECELTLSTARPAVNAKVPELDPWYLDRYHPPVPAAPAAPAAFAMAGGRADAAYGGMPAPGASFREVAATVEQGLTAATYTPPRPVAVPADGAAHRATIAAIELETKLDYITAPVRSTDVHLRATVVNSGTHTLPAGKAAVFHDADFVGSAALPLWAPGEEVELALGLDDRIRVERELTRRTATKATLGSTRRREVEYETKIENHTPRPAHITVLDQLPVPRDHDITVKPVTATPDPTETTDLGILTWQLDLEPGAQTTIRLGFRVETAKAVDLTGWRE
ncbi:mucoidy inhibitor MuiA family protein [Kribbella sp. NPDC051587]|uniref:mucoidy inhibitor MuiA family protein n=1 Tax=Kribbella sp. NPDC051587 TaxID=3364119 RepID=UPI0037B629DD